MRATALPPTARFGVAGIASAASVALPLLLAPYWPSTVPFLLAYPAVALSGWLGGLWPGTFATALCTLAARYFWFAPRRSWAVTTAADTAVLIEFAAVGVIISVLNETWRRRAAAMSESKERLPITPTRPADSPTTELPAGQLAAIVESSDDAIVGKRLDGVITSWNRAAEEMFGYSATEAVGQSIRMLIPKDRWSEEDDVLRRLRHGHRVRHFETVRLRKDATEIPVSLTISPILDAHGHVIGASKIARDISERKALERERAELLAREQAARADLERASRLKDEFLAALSHELRTPLNAVLGYATLLSTGAVTPERTAHALRAIRRNAEALARLVESLLDLSRIMAGKLELDVQDVQLPAAVEAAVDVVRPEAESKGLTIAMVRPASEVVVAGDPWRLQQVFWNLLSNAVKFTPSGGRIDVLLETRGAQAQVEVRDTGAGIPAKFLPHVFDRFSQAEGLEHRSPAGLGLGLALAQEMVQAHGGTVTAFSEGEGRGSTFTVLLPLISR